MDPAILKLILQDRKMAYAVTDQNLKVVEVSGAIELFHEDRNAWLGCPLPAMVPELVGNEKALTDILAGKLPRFELAWVNRETETGAMRYLTMIDLPYRHQAGQITGLIHLMGDVTEMGRLKQKLAQQRNELRLLQEQLTRQNQELAAANAELQQLSDMKSMFVSVAAHELRTPLTSINGFVELLLDEDSGPLTGNQREYLGIVQSSAHRLLTITNNLLDVTRIETGRIELVLQPCDLPALVEATVTEFRPQLENKSQHLTLRAEASLPAALCDKTRAAQIIGNLLSNASKYTPSGGLIAINIVPAQEEGFLQVSVIDNGIGIAGEEQPKLFKRFFRAQSSALVKASGAGLGLHITRSLVELHGGRIWFESELDRGSAFHVTFPIAGQPATTLS